MLLTRQASAIVGLNLLETQQKAALLVTAAPEALVVRAHNIILAFEFLCITICCHVSLQSFIWGVEVHADW